MPSRSASPQRAVWYEKEMATALQGVDAARQALPPMRKVAAALRIGLLMAGYVTAINILVAALTGGLTLAFPWVFVTAGFGGAAGFLAALGLSFWAARKGRGEMPSRSAFQWMCTAWFIVFFLLLDMYGWIQFPRAFSLSEILRVPMDFLVGYAGGQAMGNVLHRIVVPPLDKTVVPDRPVLEDFPYTPRANLNIPTTIVAPGREGLSRKDSAAAPAWRIKDVE